MPEVIKMPVADKEWVVWGENFVPKVAAHAVRDNITPEDVTAEQDTFTAFKAGVILASGPDSTPVIVAQKNDDRGKFVAQTRSIVNFLQSSAITDAQRVDYGINVWDKTRSKSAPLFTHVVLEAGHTQSGFLTSTMKKLLCRCAPITGRSG
ncbi:hypothetical protein ACYULU_12115 [Breznakiellaceae bacterium SP9]